MEAHGNENPVAQAIAQAMIEGFNKHYRIFRETSRHAKESFEAADWQDQLSAVRNRVQFYDDRVNETVQRLHEEFDAESIDDATWQAVKLHYIGLLLNHKQPELAETFFNSVTTITVDTHGLAVSHQSGLGPIKGAVKKDYELSWASVRHVYDVEKRRLTKHGNVNSSFEFRAGNHTVHSALFGTMARDGKYLEFLEAVRAAVGDKLVQKDDLGELEAPLARLIDMRIAASEQGAEPPKRPPAG